MKKTLLLIGGLFLLQWGFTQTNKLPVDKKSTFMVSAGPAFPIGAFGKSNTDDAGYAKTGYNLNLQYAYNFGQLGIIAHGFYSNHGTKPMDLGMEMTSSNWKYYGLTAGVIRSMPVNSGKWAFDVKALLGVGFATTPEMVFMTGGETGTIKVEPINGTAFLYEAGLGTRYMVNSNMFILGGVDFMGMKPKFKTTIGTESIEGEQQINVLNLHAGIGFRF